MSEREARVLWWVFVVLAALVMALWWIA